MNHLYPTRGKILPLAGLLAALFTAHAFAADDTAALRARALEHFEPLPDKMPGAEHDTPALAKLGKKLYFDKRLSADKTISCFSCHKLNSQANPYSSPTLVGASGKPIERSSPTVLNAGFHVAQFWDGRAADLEAQAKLPLMNPDEMGMPPEAELIRRLRAKWLYRYRFEKAFPGAADPFTVDNMAKAIATYERTLVTHDRFDEFLKGSDGALSKGERAGLKLFLDTGCAQCHDGAGLGGGAFQRMGFVNAYANTNDGGRARITHDDADRFKFKVPSLRNVALTAPYFHDSGATTLSSAIRQMAWLQLDKKLSPVEVESIETFLHALSDKKLAVLRSPTPAGVLAAQAGRRRK